VQDPAGKVIRTITAPGNERTPGVHRIAWDLRDNPPAKRRLRSRRGWPARG
jgi:hypothetical protein